MPATSLPDPAGPAARMSSGEQAAQRIRELIFEGELAPGTRIPQDELAASLEISRIPLREALIALEREGWVTIELHRGAFVNTLDEGALLDHYDMLGTVYGFAARRSLARSPGPELLADLRRLQTELDAEPDPVKAGQLLRALHRRIIEAARSPRTVMLLRAIPSLVPRDIFSLLPESVDVERRAVATILDALTAGDGDAAALAYEQMMREVGMLVAKLFEEHHLYGTVDEAPA